MKDRTTDEWMWERMLQGKLPGDVMCGENGETKTRVGQGEPRSNQGRRLRRPEEAAVMPDGHGEDRVSWAINDGAPMPALEVVGANSACHGIHATRARDRPAAAGGNSFPDGYGGAGRVLGGIRRGTDDYPNGV